MKRLSLVLTCLFFFIGCGGKSGGGSSTSLVAENGTCPGTGDGGNALPSVSGSNVMTMTIGGLSICSYNQPCVSVTVCDKQTPTSHCSTVSNILVDTGSYGLRVFKSALVAANSQFTVSPAQSLSKPVVECAQFGSATLWGPVMSADVTLAGQTPTMTVQVVDSTFGKIPDSCKTPFAPATSPTDDGVGFNGILGVGLGQIDCSSCTSRSDVGVYFRCDGSSSSDNCTSILYGSGSQVVNPVVTLTTHNNGVVLQLPSIPSSGSATTTGNLIFGINTDTTNHNNYVTGSEQVFKTDGYGNFTTNFADTDMSNSFIDSGSNGFFFPQVSQTPYCSGSSGWFCAGSSQCLAANMKSYGTSTTQVINFPVGDTSYLDGTNNFALNSLSGGSGDTTMFDWGLPFFYGRTVYTGVYNKTSPLGTGPYWAF